MSTTVAPVTTTPTARSFSWRAFTSLLVVLSFVTLATTGLVLYVTPPGRVANWSGWTLAGVTKTNWQAVHMVFGFLFLAAGAAHLYFNWKVLLHYLRSRTQAGIPRGRELALATGAVVALVALSIADVPPVSAVAEVRERLADSWSSESTEPPLPHAELLSLEQVAATMKVPVEEAVQRLASKGFEASSAATLETIAAQRGVTPREVFAALRTTAPVPAAPAVAGAGMGWKTLRQVCEELHVPVEAAVAQLRAGGIDGGPDEPLREIAKRNDRHAPEIVALLKGK